jgi:anti-sigma B factor antagonist
MLDSSGLGVLVGALRRMTVAGGDLVVVCSSPRVLELFVQCRLDRVFEIRSSLADLSTGTRRG